MVAFPDIDPVIISLGPLAVSWYSLSYVCGILFGWFYAYRVVDYNLCNLSKKHIDDFISSAIIGIVLGGRLGYVLFYDPAKYWSDPIEILKTYEGGMSFHGGLIGCFTAGYLFSKRKNLKLLLLTDISFAIAPIGLFLGRIANFINAELYGRITDVPWAVIFPYSDGNPRHPSQLYEAFLEGLVLFVIIQYFIYKRYLLKKPGVVSGIFLILYGCFRAFVEFFREPDIKVGFVAKYFTLGQMLCLPMILIGVGLLFYASYKQTTKL